VSEGPPEKIDELCSVRSKWGESGCPKGGVYLSFGRNDSGLYMGGRWVGVIGSWCRRG